MINQALLCKKWTRDIASPFYVNFIFPKLTDRCNCIPKARENTLGYIMPKNELYYSK